MLAIIANEGDFLRCGRGDTIFLDLDFRKPTLADAAHITRLIRRCPPLDVNSDYLTLLLCRDFHSTCVVAQFKTQVVGFLSAYIPPGRNDTVFVWQLAVDPRQRSAGIASRMLDALLARPACGDVSWLETTIAPSNAPSQKVFRSLASRLETDCLCGIGFPAEMFDGAGDHEAEELYRIGPFTLPNHRQNHRQNHRREGPLTS